MVQKIKKGNSEIKGNGQIPSIFHMGCERECGGKKKSNIWFETVVAWYHVMSTEQRHSSTLNVLSLRYSSRF